MSELRYERIIGADRNTQLARESSERVFQKLERNESLDGSVIKGISLVGNTTNVISHKLGRAPRGWRIERHYGSAPTAVAIPRRVNIHKQGGYGKAFGVTLSWTPTDGNALVLVYAAVNGANITSVTQTGATWNAVKQYATSTTGASIWAAPNIQGAATTLTVTSGAIIDTSVAFIIAEYNGLLQSWPMKDDDSSANGLSALPASGIATTVDERRLNIGCLGCRRSDASFSNPYNGFALAGQQAGTGPVVADGQTVALLEKVSDFAGDEEAKSDLTSAVPQWAASIGCLIPLTGPVDVQPDFPIETSSDARFLNLWTTQTKTIDLRVW